MAVKTVANNIGTGAVEWVWRKKLFALRLDAPKRRMKSPEVGTSWQIMATVRCGLHGVPRLKPVVMGGSTSRTGHNHAQRAKSRR